MKITQSRLKQIIREELRALRQMPEIADVIEQGRNSMDLVEITNEIGALIVQNHYIAIEDHDEGIAGVASDVVAEFEKVLMPYMNDYFGDAKGHADKLGTTTEWLEEAIHDELKELKDEYVP